MMRYIIASFSVLCTVAVASPASACRSPAGVLAIVHNAVPNRIPEGAVVLDVDFPPTARSQGSVAIEARVRRVVHGTFTGRSVRVRADRRSSCHYPFSNGRSGLIVGHLRERDGMPVFQPVYVPRRTGFRLLR